VWRLSLNPSKVNRFDQAKDLIQRSRHGVGGLVYARGAPTTWIVVVTPTFYKNKIFAHIGVHIKL
jgi:hypothetical protein